MSNNHGRAALAETFAPTGLAGVLTTVALILAGTLVLAISAKIKVPFYPVPVTLQTLAVMGIAAAYGSRLAVLTVFAYIAEGMLGFPVFANTPPAVASPIYLLGPTGGFIAGFVVIAAIVGYAADRGWDRSVGKLFGAMVVAEVVMMAMGFAWLAWFATLSPGLLKMLGVPEGTAGTGIAFAWNEGVAKFLVGDLLKIALAALAVPAIWRLVERKG